MYENFFIYVGLFLGFFYMSLGVHIFTRENYNKNDLVPGLFMAITTFWIMCSLFIIKGGV